MDKVELTVNATSFVGLIVAVLPHGKPVYRQLYIRNCPTLPPSRALLLSSFPFIVGINQYTGFLFSTALVFGCRRHKY